jgi:uncharacterized protein YjbJ (UPF0337 family)
MMDWNQIEGNWTQFKVKIREKWADLTEDDVEKILGRREELESKLQECYGFTKDAIRNSVDEWLKTLH